MHCGMNESLVEMSFTIGIISFIVTMYCNPKTLLVGLFKIVYRRLFIGMLKYKTLIKGRYVCIFSSC